MKRVAVLASGSGTNLQAIIDYLAELGDAASARVALVASDHADAGALERARTHGIEAVVLDKASRTSGLLPILEQRGIDLVVLAGYMRLVPAAVTRAYRGRIVNIHPALLPAFGGQGMYGMRVHEAVIASGVRTTGATVHFVDERYDEGPIISQQAVDVLPDDTPETLAARVLAAEHFLYPRVVDAVASGTLALGDDGKVVLNPKGPPHFVREAGPPSEGPPFPSAFRT